MHTPTVPCHSAQPRSESKSLVRETGGFSYKSLTRKRTGCRARGKPLNACTGSLACTFCYKALVRETAGFPYKPKREIVESRGRARTGKVGRGSECNNLHGKALLPQARSVSHITRTANNNLYGKPAVSRTNTTNNAHNAEKPKTMYGKPLVSRKNIIVVVRSIESATTCTRNKLPSKHNESCRRPGLLAYSSYRGISYLYNRMVQETLVPTDPGCPLRAPAQTTGK